MKVSRRGLATICEYELYLKVPPDPRKSKYCYVRLFFYKKYRIRQLKNSVEQGAGVHQVHSKDEIQFLRAFS